MFPAAKGLVEVMYIPSDGQRHEHFSGLSCKEIVHQKLAVVPGNPFWIERDRKYLQVLHFITFNTFIIGLDTAGTRRSAMGLIEVSVCIPRPFAASTVSSTTTPSSRAIFLQPVSKMPFRILVFCLDRSLQRTISRTNTVV